MEDSEHCMQAAVEKIKEQVSLLHVAMCLKRSLFFFLTGTKEMEFRTEGEALFHFRERGMPSRVSLLNRADLKAENKSLLSAGKSRKESSMGNALDKVGYRHYNMFDIEQYYIEQYHIKQLRANDGKVLPENGE